MDLQSEDGASDCAGFGGVFNLKVSHGMRNVGASWNADSVIRKPTAVLFIPLLSVVLL